MRKIITKNKLDPKIIKESQKVIGNTLQRLKETYPSAHCSLDFKNPLQLLIATILSAQCTDKRVNMVTPMLFSRFPNVETLAEADLEEVQEIIRSTGFYRNKAKNIIACCRMISLEFGGEVPDEMDKLLTLPGVARKTANVVLWNAFGKNEGVVVDTHVQRTSMRLGWTANTVPVKIEQDLMKLIPRNDWGQLSHLLIDLGRDVCKAPTPDCNNCKIWKFCPTGRALRSNI